MVRQPEIASAIVRVRAVSGQHGVRNRRQACANEEEGIGQAHGVD
jgi:hypothetical protein